MLVHDEAPTTMTTWPRIAHQWSWTSHERFTRARSTRTSRGVVVRCGTGVGADASTVAM